MTPVPIPKTKVPARRDWETVDGSFMPEDGGLFLVLEEENGDGKEKKGEDNSGDSSRFVRCFLRLRLYSSW